MKELIVNKVALSYSSLEDRLRMQCFLNNETHPIWITQLMVNRLIPAIANWVLKNGGVQSTDTIQRSFLHTNFFHGKSHNSKVAPKTLQQNAQIDRQQDSNSDKVASLSAHSFIQPWVCTTARIAMSKERIRLVLGAEGRSVNYLLSMNAFEAGHFLMVFKKVLDKTYWPIDWPVWLDSKLASELENQASFIH